MRNHATYFTAIAAILCPGLVNLRRGIRKRKPLRAALSAASCESLESRVLLTGLQINVTYDTSVLLLPNSQQVQTAVNYAVDRFEALFQNPITINIKVVAEPGTNTLGSSLSTLDDPHTYSEIRNALLATVTADDAVGAIAGLSASDPSGGADFVVPSAEAKALGLRNATDSSLDGTFTFGTGFDYTFDPNSRAIADKYDFIGIAEHEISEIMGRIYYLDNQGGASSIFVPFDLFRFTGPGARTLDPGATGVYFSNDGGVTVLSRYSTVSDLQDWATASPYVADAFNAFGNPNSRDDLTPADVTVMHVLGYVPSLTSLVVGQGPTGATAGVAINPVTLIEKDPHGVTNVSDSSLITATIVSGPVGATIGGTIAVHAINGVATFSDLTFALAGTYKLKFTDDSLKTITTGTFTINAASANQLIVTHWPSSVAAGAHVSPAVVVQVEDQFGNAVANDPIAITLASGPNAALHGVINKSTNASGVATFTDISLNLAGTYTLTATESNASLTQTSPSFTVTPGVPIISFVQPPTDVAAGVAIGPAITVRVKDSFGNLFINSSVTLSIATGPNGPINGTLTVATDSSGIATFNDISLNLAGNYTLKATEGAFSGKSVLFSVHAATATSISFLQQPTDVPARAAISPSVTVQAMDAFGNLVTGETIKLAIATGPSNGSLGTLTQTTNASGVATFTNVILQHSGVFSLVASDQSFSATSNTFTVVPSATHVAFNQQPSGGIAGQPVTNSLTVYIEDDQNNVMTNDNSTVTLKIATGPAGSTLSGTLSTSAINGVAVFNNLTLSKAGLYTLQATDGALAAATSSSFTITGVPTHMTILHTPTTLVAGHTISQPMTVQILDAANNLVTADTSTVTFAISVGPIGSILGGTVTALVQNGIATFNDFSFNKAGPYTLIATDPGLLAQKSTSFTVTADPATAHLVLTQQPATPIVGKIFTPPLILQVQDVNGNVVITDTSLVTLSILSGPTAGTLTGTASLHASKGIATFANLSIPLVGSYTLQVADPALANPTAVQVPITINPGVTTIPAPKPAASYIFGQTITLSSSLTSTAPTTLPFTGIATITDASLNVLGTTTLTSAGLAKFTLTNLSPGTYLSTISYPGDTNHTAASSSTFTLQINQAATTTVLNALPATLVFGQSLTLTATVSSPTAPGTPRTGSVSFYDGATLIGSASINGSTAVFTLAPTTGPHAFKAIYSGDTNFNTSTSPIVSRPVAKDKSTITLTSAIPSPIPHNQTTNLNVHVAILSPGSAPLASILVTIKDNGKTLTTLNLDSNGDATLAGLTFTSSGVHSLTAIFAGDLNTLTSTSALLKLTVT